ncbi:hypothetical protein M426DRAFT_8478 [Hypoxylon sp. CI-4A]|nr:hypothetical protein M426DRAFT_8478 [Hypoxylon sp. CI-4A]
MESPYIPPGQLRERIQVLEEQQQVYDIRIQNLQNEKNDIQKSHDDQDKRRQEVETELDRLKTDRAQADAIRGKFVATFGATVATNADLLGLTDMALLWATGYMKIHARNHNTTIRDDIHIGERTYNRDKSSALNQAAHTTDLVTDLHMIQINDLDPSIPSLRNIRHEAKSTFEAVYRMRVNDAVALVNLAHRQQTRLIFEYIIALVNGYIRWKIIIMGYLKSNFPLPRTRPPPLGSRVRNWKLRLNYGLFLYTERGGHHVEAAYQRFLETVFTEVHNVVDLNMNCNIFALRQCTRDFVEACQTRHHRLTNGKYSVSISELNSDGAFPKNMPSFISFTGGRVPHFAFTLPEQGTGIPSPWTQPELDGQYFSLTTTPDLDLLGGAVSTMYERGVDPHPPIDALSNLVETLPPIVDDQDTPRGGYWYMIPSTGFEPFNDQFHASRGNQARSIRNEPHWPDTRGRGNWYHLPSVSRAVPRSDPDFHYWVLIRGRSQEEAVPAQFAEIPPANSAATNAETPAATPADGDNPDQPGGAGLAQALRGASSSSYYYTDDTEEDDELPLHLDYRRPAQAKPYKLAGGRLTMSQTLLQRKADLDSVAHGRVTKRSRRTGRGP